MAVKEKAVSKSAGGGGKSGSGRGPDGPILPELLRTGSYKPNQGRTVRMVTWATVGVIFVLSAWRLHETLSLSAPNLQWIAPGGLLAVGLWLSYRIVNIPKFAEFLIAVEAEMSKVSWPTRTELIRSSLVVIGFIISLAAILFCFDLFWQFVFQKLGVI